MAQDNPNFPVGTAAVSWLDSGGTIHIRVYSTDGFNVSERCWDGSGWTNGSFGQAGSAVSATCWQGSGGLSIRVYCNFEDTTTEWCIDQGGGWYKGAYTTM
jgi:hypothetical protein